MVVSPSPTTTLTNAGAGNREISGPAPNVVYRIRRSHRRGIRDRWPDNEATILPPEGRCCAPQHLVLRGTYNFLGQE